MIESPWLPMDRKAARDVIMICGGFVIFVVVLCGTFLWKLVFG